MYQKFRETLLFAFLARFDQKKMPLDASLNEYLKAHKSIGAHDRRFIGDTVYALMRWRDSLDYLLTSLGKKSSWESRYAIWRNVDLNNLSSNLPTWVRCGASHYYFDELLSASKREERDMTLSHFKRSSPTNCTCQFIKNNRSELLDRWQTRMKARAMLFSFCRDSL
jgi:hypothetical protein